MTTRARLGPLDDPQDTMDAAAFLRLRERGGANKYGAIRTEVDGVLFDSKREAAHYAGLRLLERGGAIRDLRIQVLYRFVVNGVKVGRYTADFVFVDEATGLERVQDAKGFHPRDWPLRKKLMLACFGIEVEEV